MTRPLHLTFDIAWHPSLGNKIPSIMPFKIIFISPQILSYYWWYPLLNLVVKVRDIRLVLDQDCKTVVFLFPIRKAWSTANIIPVHNGQVRWKTTVGFSYDKFVLICICYMVPPQPSSPFLHSSRPFVWILPMSLPWFQRRFIEGVRSEANHLW